jgi:hypothetical protein
MRVTYKKIRLQPLPAATGAPVSITGENVLLEGTREPVR